MDGRKEYNTNSNFNWKCILIRRKAICDFDTTDDNYARVNFQLLIASDNGKWITVELVEFWVPRKETWANQPRQKFIDVPVVVVVVADSVQALDVALDGTSGKMMDKNDYEWVDCLAEAKKQT